MPAVPPKHVVDAVLYPHVKMREADRDVTVFRVGAVSARRTAIPRTVASTCSTVTTRNSLHLHGASRPSPARSWRMATLCHRHRLNDARKVLTGELFRRTGRRAAHAGVFSQRPKNERASWGEGWGMRG